MLTARGAAAGLPVEESTAGKNGGIGSAVGIYSTNILNANITFGDIAIKAIGGNTYSPGNHFRQIYP